MGKNALLKNGFLTASDTLKERQPTLHAIIHLHIDEIGSRESMLRDQHGLVVTDKLGYNSGRLALECCYEFSSHLVILE